LKSQQKNFGVAGWNATVRAGVAAFVLLTFPSAALASDIYVIDGDTIIVDGEHIRIANIDAPEIHSYKCASELARGEKAKVRMEAMVSAGALTIVRGDKGRMFDRYGRTLGRVLVNGKDVGESLISEGLARRWDGRRHPWCR
jgi:endonuclease YncB( thermonuclease family)